jgi:hypothetical protein
MSFSSFPGQRLDLEQERLCDPGQLLPSVHLPLAGFLGLYETVPLELSQTADRDPAGGDPRSMSRFVLGELAELGQTPRRPYGKYSVDCAARALYNPAAFSP